MRYGRAATSDPDEEEEGLNMGAAAADAHHPATRVSASACSSLSTSICLATLLCAATTVAFFLGMVVDFWLNTSRYPGDFTRRSASDLEAEIYRALRPCARCKDPARFGKVGDGGYVMCKELVRPEHGKTIYSYGIGDDDSWGAAVSNHLGGVTVQQYDCVRRAGPACPPNLRCSFNYHRECLGDVRPKGGFMYTSRSGALADHLTTNGYGPLQTIHSSPTDRPGPDPALFADNLTADIIAKIDIENYEWAMLANDSNKAVLARLSQLVVELHRLDDPDIVKARAMRNALDIFAVVHVHGNNWADKTVKLRGFNLPNNLELSLVRRDLVEAKPCEDLVAYSGLDVRNNVHAPEITEIRLGGN